MVNDVNRIQPFCVEFAYIWENRCADWCFAHLVSRVFEHAKEHGKTPSTLNDKDFIDCVYAFFKDEDEKDLKKTIQCKDCRDKPRRETPTHTCLTKYFVPEYQRKQIKGCSRGKPKDGPWEYAMSVRGKRVREAIQRRREKAIKLAAEEAPRPLPSNTRPVVAFDGTRHKRYKSIAEATEATGVKRSAIIGLCQGKRKSYKGYTFMYAEDYKRMKEREKQRKRYYRMKERAMLAKEAELEGDIVNEC